MYVSPCATTGAVGGGGGGALPEVYPAHTYKAQTCVKFVGLFFQPKQRPQTMQPSSKNGV
jgi:hypothetical protein